MTSAAAIAADPPAPAVAPPGSMSDFDFLHGAWRVRHERLVGRLVGSTEWQAFEGTSETRPVMGGQGNLEDNVLHLPSGTYKAVALRMFDPDRRAWSIWWVDSRTAAIEPPVVGGFEDGRGVFFGDDVHEGRPVRVRFRWFVDGPDRARWEQAFSGDGGQTWETNWRMAFERVG